MAPDEHDACLAWLSHAPQLLSTILAAGSDAARLELAGSGFRDMIRLAGSPYSVWEGILRTNRDNIDLALDLLAERIGKIRLELKNGSLAAEFARAGRVYETVKRLKSR